MQALAAVEQARAGLESARTNITSVTVNRGGGGSSNRYRNGYASYLEELDAQRSS